MNEYSKNRIAYVVFLTHHLAAAWGKTVPEAFGLLDESGILGSYILPCYETLHSEGTEAVVEDITLFAREKGYAV